MPDWKRCEDEMPEEWRRSSLFPHYSVSSFGRIRRDSIGPGATAGRILSQSVSAYGYLKVGLYNGSKGSRKTELVHRLVAVAFLGQAPPGKSVNHIDGDKLNNRPSNLEWATVQEQSDHAMRAGLIAGRAIRRTRGARLPDADIAAIKWGSCPVREAADSFGISPRRVMRIRASARLPAPPEEEK